MRIIQDLTATQFEALSDTEKERIFQEIDREDPAEQVEHGPSGLRRLDPAKDADELLALFARPIRENGIAHSRF